MVKKKETCLVGDWKKRKKFLDKALDKLEKEQEINNPDGLTDLRKEGIVSSRLPKAPSELNDRQVAMIYMMVDPALRNTSDTEKCRQLGISRVSLWKWKNNPVFLKYYHDCRYATIRTTGHLVDKALLNKCLKGDVAAMKLYYQLTGELFDRKEIKAEVALYAHLDIEQSDLIKEALKRKDGTAKIITDDSS